jgi:hypothetical protein
MPPTVTYIPATPRPVVDGILITVTGEVQPLARVEVKDTATNKVHYESNEFEQGLNPDISTGEVIVAITGAPTGGTYTLNADDGADLGDTAAIAFDANQYDVNAAVKDAWGDANVYAEEHEDGIRIVFMGSLANKAVTVTSDDALLTGGTTPAAEVTEVHAGGTAQSGSGPYQCGPWFMPEGDYEIDVVVARDTDTEDEGDTLLTAPVALEVADA